MTFQRSSVFLINIVSHLRYLAQILSSYTFIKDPYNSTLYGLCTTKTFVGSLDARQHLRIHAEEPVNLA